MADGVGMSELIALLLLSSLPSAERAYMTASEIVLFAEMLGSTSTLFSPTTPSSKGSALLSDITANKQLLLVAKQHSWRQLSCMPR